VLSLTGPAAALLFQTERNACRPGGIEFNGWRTAVTMFNSHVGTALLLVALAVSIGLFAAAAKDIHLPRNHQGFEPEQPIAFSHRLHAGDLAIDCLYCHTAAEKSRHAGLPPASTCMNCHKLVTASWGAIRAEDRVAKEEKRKPRTIISPELKKLYDYLGLDEELKPRPDASPEPIPWVRVHDLPDFVYFDHRAHVSVGVECQRCHGEVESMERVRQVESLNMGWCVNCHREANEQGINGLPVRASLDCASCHF
jgi:hypothetical protein